MSLKGRRYSMLVCESSFVISDFFVGVLRGALCMNRAGDVLPKTTNLCVSVAVGLTLGGLFVGLGTKLPQSKSLQLQRTWLAWENVQLRNHRQARDDEGLWFLAVLAGWHHALELQNSWMFHLSYGNAISESSSFFLQMFKKVFPWLYKCSKNVCKMIFLDWGQNHIMNTVYGICSTVTEHDRTSVYFEYTHRRRESIRD